MILLRIILRGVELAAAVAAVAVAIDNDDVELAGYLKLMTRAICSIAP